MLLFDFCLGSLVGFGAPLFQGFHVAPRSLLSPGFLATSFILIGFHGGSDSNEYLCNAGELGSIPGSGRAPGVFLPGEFHGQRSLVDYSLWDCEESDMAEQRTQHSP